MLIKDKESYRLSILSAIVVLLTIPFLLAVVEIVYFKVMIVLSVSAIGYVILSKSSGLELDFSMKRYRKYNKFLRKTKGEWRDLSKFHNIVVLSKTGSGTLMTSSVKVLQGFYELYLMDENHIKRLFILGTDDFNVLQRKITTLKLKLNIPEVPYNPITKITCK
jgi:hypothetical protein